MHLVALDRVEQRPVVGLVRELRAVHPDDGEHVGEPLLERPQLVEHVQAVDAAGGPEVEQHEPAAQPLERQRPVGADPPAGATELGGADTGGAVRGGHVSILPDGEVGGPAGGYGRREPGRGGAAAAGAAGGRLGPQPQRGGDLTRRRAAVRTGAGCRRRPASVVRVPVAGGPGVRSSSQSLAGVGGSWWWAGGPGVGVRGWFWAARLEGGCGLPEGGDGVGAAGGAGPVQRAVGGAGGGPGEGLGAVAAAAVRAQVVGVGRAVRPGVWRGRGRCGCCWWRSRGRCTARRGRG